MGIKILAVGLILLAVSLLGIAQIPELVTGVLILIGSIGVLAGF